MKIFINIARLSAAMLGSIRAMFNVSFDFSIMKGSAMKERKDGKEFWSFLFEVAIFYGGPEVKAQIVWKENVSQLCVKINIS